MDVLKLKTNHFPGRTPHVHSQTWKILLSRGPVCGQARDRAASAAAGAQAPDRHWVHDIFLVSSVCACEHTVLQVYVNRVMKIVRA